MNGIRVSVLLLFVSVCQADNIPLVRGRVESEAIFMGNDMVIELRPVDARLDSSYQSSITNTGGFELRDVKSGTYTLRVTSMRGDTISEQMVDLFPYSGELSIRLPKLSSGRPGTSSCT